MSATSWTTVVERGSLWGLRLTAAVYRYGGRRLAVGLVALVVTYFFLTDRRGRAASRAYFRRVYAHPHGAAALGRPPGARDSFRQYFEFGLAALDRLRFALGPTESIEMVVHGEEALARLVARGEGAVLVGAHLGSFEALRVLAKRSGVPVNVVMSTRYSARFTAVLARHTGDPALRVVDLAFGGPEATAALQACVARGEFVAILADRVGPGVQARPLRAPFFGVEAAFPRGPFLLAAMLQCPVILLVAIRHDARRYEIFVEPLASPAVAMPAGRRQWADAVVTDFARRLERLCLRAPHQWFNFFDFWADRSAPRKAVAV
jgi:predicted LPLAT superfamily acyltransferase